MTNEEFIKSISIEGEEWRDVVGFENLYKVSSHGRIVSLAKEYSTGFGVKQSPPKLLKPWLRTTGYLEVYLCKNGVRKHSAIHRLVAIAFIDNPWGYPHIDHIDTNRINNHVNNLRWVTQQMNQLNSLTRKHISDGHKGVRTGKPAWTRRAVVQLLNGTCIKTYDCIKHVINDGFNNVSVVRCCKNQQRDHKGYQWMYKSDYNQLVNTEQSD